MVQMYLSNYTEPLFVTYTKEKHILSSEIGSHSRKKTILANRKPKAQRVKPDTFHPSPQPDFKSLNSSFQTSLRT